MSGATLLLLADALNTTADELLGAGIELPPGGRDAASHPVLRELDREECLQLLTPSRIGRLAVSTPAGPEVLPVNSCSSTTPVIIRTRAGGSIAAHVDRDVGFEVDHIDEAMREGWSVLITGKLRWVPDEDLWAPHPRTRRASALGRRTA